MSWTNRGDWRSSRSLPKSAASCTKFLPSNPALGRRNALVRWAFSVGGGAGVTEPRDLTDLVPNDVRAELAVAVAVLEQHGPAVTEALRQLDQATTAAWQALHPVAPTDDEWRLVERATGIDRGWDAAYRLVSTLDPPGRGRSPA
jgi:hypothetical protein